MPTKTLDDLLPILNLPCGDVLKAHLLNHFHPEIPRLNPIWLQGGPRGEAEAAFAAARQNSERLGMIKEAFQSAAADKALDAFKADHKPQPVVAKPGMAYTRETPVVVPVTDKGSLNSAKAAKSAGFQDRNAAIKAQIAEAKAAGIPQAREEPVAAKGELPQTFHLDGSEWVTIREAARRLGLKEATVYVQTINSRVAKRVSPEGIRKDSKVYLWSDLEQAFGVRRGNPKRDAC